MPGPPPMNSAAATMLVAKKAIATGMPSIISPTPRPNRSSAAQYHCIQGLLRLPAEADEEILAPRDEAQELDAHHRERQRDEADHHPPRFFFSSRRRHTRFSRDWSSDVCSSDLCNANKFAG